MSGSMRAALGIGLGLLLLVAGVSAGGAAGDEVRLVNRLAAATSPYLGEAARSPVAWQPWGPEAFHLAKTLDRPILLSVGAGWCHWCHVMDREAYGDRGIAALINGHFVPVKVDRDERPDIDARYQQVARAVFDTGGWPLTLILTPEGKVVVAGSTFLAEARDGLPGLRQFLPRVTAFYRDHRREFLSTAEAAHRVLSVPDLLAGGERGSDRVADEILEAALSHFDAAHGGFGDEAKDTGTTILELAFRRYGETEDPRLREVIVRTLDGMAAGAIRDHLGGGFFRYTTDRAWREPHFEKLDYVQAQLLAAYLRGYQMTGERRYRELAEELLRYVGRVLARPDGGFRAHQDADGAGGDAAHYLLERGRSAAFPAAGRG